MAEIDLSNTANITLASVPSGVAEPSINSIALFTIESPSQTGAYTAHVSSSTVGELYGTSSLTYKMAQAIFSQTPNLRTGDGTLYVIPYVGTSATSATWTSPNITSAISTFQAVTNGSLKLTLDGGTAVQVTGLDFSNVTTVADIAAVLNGAGFDMFVEATSTGVKFISKRVGSESSISFSSASAGTDIGGSAYLNGSGGTVVAGVDSTSQETLAEAVTRMKDTISFGGVLTTQMLDNADILANATTIQTYNMLWLEGTCALANIAILGNSIKSASNTHTHIMAYSNGLADMKCCIAAALSRALSVNWAGTNTANTLNLKQLATIQPDLNLNQTYYGQAKQYGVDLYGSTQGYSCYYSFDNGAYVDEIVMNMFLKSKLEIGIFNALATANAKVPQTEAGVAVIKSAIQNIVIQGVRNGYIAAGKWNTLSNRFGDLEDFDANIAQHGYYIYSQPVAQQSQADREARKCPLIQIAVKRSGAIHSVSGEVILER